MKIAQLCSVGRLVSHEAPHGIYGSVGNLSDALVDHGHEVALYASGDALTRAKVIAATAVNAKTRGVSETEIMRENLETASLCYRQADKYDIIHSHFSLLGCHFSQIVSTPTVHSIHSPVTPDLWEHLLKYKKERFISFSHAQRRRMPDLNWVGTVYHSIDTKTYAFSPEPQGYALYLGRITEDKGVHHAIAAAKEAGIQLLVVGTSYPSEGYWSEKIEPHVDGSTVRFLGPADLKRKIELLQGAKVLLFPTLYDEVFGLVMIEAMACGTPTIGFDNGAVSEIVEDGQTGYVVRTPKQMAAAIKKIDKISRQACRDRAEKLFSIEKMVRGYERVYERVIASSKKTS
jgi:glycosyltransferase involved in cell wall biosynthesis